MIEKASGKMPPPTPWITRPTSMRVSDEAIAETKVPIPSRASTIRSSRSLPYMSPSRPMMGVVTEALKRKAVRTQPTELSLVCRDSWICGSAGTTSDCSSAYAIPPSERTARIVRGLGFCVAAHDSMTVADAFVATNAFVCGNFRCMATGTEMELGTPAGITQRWPTLLMVKLGRITMHRFTQALLPHGLKPRQLAALIELRDHGELSQQALCGRLHVDPTNLVEVLNELEDHGYATRRRDPEDRRRHRVVVTKKGLAVIDKVSATMDEVEGELLADLDAAEREALEALLHSIWERAGGYDAYSEVAAAEEKPT